MRRALTFVHLLPLFAVACHCGEPSAGPPDAAVEARKSGTTTASCPLDEGRAPVAAAGETAGGGEDELVAALRTFDKTYDAHRYEEALACAQEAIRLDPESTEGLVDKGFALEALAEPDAARDAYERAVAIDPEDPGALRAAANFLVDRGTDDALETAALYARRGREHASDAVGAADLAAIEANALNGLGHNEEALAAAESALALDGENTEAAVERGVALVELVRFEEARPALEKARAADGTSAKAAYFLALLEERDGHDAVAIELFAEAARLDPENYPLAMDVDPKAFDALVQGEVAKLAEDKRAALATTAFSWTDLPATDDLKLGDPVLSPSIVGLYRPGEEGGKDAILIYRRNLLRMCRSDDELHREVRDTILHELGHLGGADDAELRDRGL